MHTIIVTLLPVLFSVAFIGYFARGFVGAHLSTILLRKNPLLYAELGSPMPNDFWARNKFPLKEFMLRLPFPFVAGDRTIQIWLNFLYCIFWLSNLSMLSCVAILVFVYPYV